MKSGQIFQVHTHGNNKVTFEPLPTLQTSYIIRNLCFINYKTLAILDQKETLRFLDARLDEEVEAIDCSELDIVYEGSRYRAEDTGGNVSRAMASLPMGAVLWLAISISSAYGSSRADPG